tara:strand:+ start:38692 stop:38982 length:291 start_codon:yes stop_codon:yes gene_type:complete
MLVRGCLTGANTQNAIQQAESHNPGQQDDGAHNHRKPAKTAKGGKRTGLGRKDERQYNQDKTKDDPYHTIKCSNIGFHRETPLFKWMNNLWLKGYN